MKTLFTNKTLAPKETIVVYAPSVTKGEEVKIVQKNGLLPFLIGVCTGGVKALMTPSRNGKTANAHRGYRKFKVKP